MTDCGEPTLRELLDDAIVRAMMASDGVAGEDVRRLIAKLPAPRVAPGHWPVWPATVAPGSEGDGRRAASATGTKEMLTIDDDPLTATGTERLPAVLRYRGLNLDALRAAQKRSISDLRKAIDALLAGLHELAARQGASSGPAGTERPSPMSDADGIGGPDRPCGAEIFALQPIQDIRPARALSAVRANCDCRARRAQADEKRLEAALLTIGMEIDRPVDRGPGGPDVPALLAARTGRR